MQLVLGAGNGVVQRVRLEGFFVDVQIFDDALDERQLVVGIHDDKITVEGHRTGFPTQNAGTDGVEGPDPHGSLNAFSQSGFNTGHHFLRGFVGEGDRENVVRADAHRAHQVDDALREHFGLAGARSGDHQCLAVPGGDSLFLLWVESFHIFHECPFPIRFFSKVTGTVP